MPDEKNIMDTVRDIKNQNEYFKSKAKSFVIINDFILLKDHDLNIIRAALDEEISNRKELKEEKIYL